MTRNGTASREEGPEADLTDAVVELVDGLLTAIGRLLAYGSIGCGAKSGPTQDRASPEASNRHRVCSPLSLLIKYISHGYAVKHRRHAADDGTPRGDPQPCPKARSPRFRHY